MHEGHERVAPDANTSSVEMCIDTNTSSIYSLPTLNAGGALDVVVVQHADGTLRSSAWFVLFDVAVTGRVAVHLNGKRFVEASVLRVTAERQAASFAANGKPPTDIPPADLLSALAASELLRNGRNELRYSIGGPGGACVRVFLYLWQASLPVVIFDIDGTVTLNDAAGHATNLLPGDASPTHAGVCQLVCELHARGYALLYLTSRPLLGVAGIERTRRFLFEVAVDQPSGFRMPPAPVLTTTHRDAFAALVDELGGKSKDFKSSALKAVRDVFEPPDGGRTLGGVLNGALGEINSKLSALGVLPAREGGGLYAGFGNREKDALAYLSAGVAPERVFLIDPSSKLVGRSAVLSDKDIARSMASARGMASSGPMAAPLAAPPSWQSYVGVLESGSLEQHFPRRVSDADHTSAIRALTPDGEAARSRTSSQPSWIKWLHEQGAPLDAKNSKGDTPASLAAEGGGSGVEVRLAATTAGANGAPAAGSDEHAACDCSETEEVEEPAATSRMVRCGAARYVALSKPYLTLCSFGEDTKGRANLSDLDLPMGVRNVGRLDRDSEGLLLLTDDGQFCHRVLQGGVAKRYYALVLGQVHASKSTPLARHAKPTAKLPC